MEWQPIDTAPHDEESYILAWDEYGYNVVRFCGGDDTDTQWFDGEFFISPTHWMPLPEPPKEMKDADVD